MKIREFLDMFKGRDPESELKGIVLPFAHDIVVFGVANRGEFANLLTAKGDASDDPPDTLPTGCTMPNCEDVADLMPGQRWDDTYIILDDETVKELDEG